MSLSSFFPQRSICYLCAWRTWTCNNGTN